MRRDKALTKNRSCSVFSGHPHLSRRTSFGGSRIAKSRPYDIGSSKCIIEGYGLFLPLWMI